MFHPDWLILRILHQSFEIERPKRSLVRGRGTSIPFTRRRKQLKQKFYLKYAPFGALQAACASF